MGNLDRPKDFDWLVIFPRLSKPMLLGFRLYRGFLLAGIFHIHRGGDGRLFSRPKAVSESLRHLDAI